MQDNYLEVVCDRSDQVVDHSNLCAIFFCFFCDFVNILINNSNISQQHYLHNNRTVK